MHGVIYHSRRLCGARQCAHVQVLVKKVFGDSGQRASKRRWKLRHLGGILDSDTSSIQR